MAKADETLKKIKANEARMNERVNVFLQRDKLHTDDVYISVNNYTALIPRGQTVNIPRFAAEALQQSMNQNADLVMRVTEMEDKYKAGINL